MGKRVPASPGFGERLEALLWGLFGERASQREIADALGVKRGRLGAWIVRGNFPGRVELAACLARLPVVASRGLDADALARWAEDGRGELVALLEARSMSAPVEPLAGEATEDRCEGVALASGAILLLQGIKAEIGEALRLARTRGEIEALIDTAEGTVADIDDWLKERKRARRHALQDQLAA